ncbi:PP2C family protein-serine/threonine phosphatase [Metasolibacillus sp. FSL K6-0083]|uniref:PP2C family protein-serine/threonine phosphatase n=1 Tax=Metasolibacillus sp. FSL K6-0083 TaxID=2921416 RepID=UPI00315A9F01
MRELKIQYKKILTDYIENQSERNLYIGQSFIRQLIQKNIAPEEVIHMHKQVMEEIFPELPAVSKDGYDFLIEIMVYFGLTLKEHQILLEQQEEMRIEMNVAAKIQSVLLKTTVPQIDAIDIGMISIPIRKMNGDYVHFSIDEQNYVGVAVTDVVGKGVPAALCMSMVKYGLDTLEYAETNPAYVLEVLNRIIEKSVDDSMFVSMFYGRLDLVRSIFTYGSAGHEPAIYYNAADNAFYGLGAKGLLLGIMPEVKYEQTEIPLYEGDFIIMMTDGVTEFRHDEEIDSRKIIEQLALTHRHLSAQEMCEKIYEELQELQEDGLDDDFTVVILKK